MNLSSTPKQAQFCHPEFDFPFNKIPTLAFIIGLLISGGARANTVMHAKVISVFDGNTIEVLTKENQKLKVLLYGIDSPELGQKFGSEAKKYLERIVLNKQVEIELIHKDSFGNHVGIVIFDDRVDLRIELLKEGLAWTAEKNFPMELEPYRTWAQRKGRGLWQEENPVPPWIYRRQQAMEKPKIR
jgi:endonuclease YncB( thermonuclease family)